MTIQELRDRAQRALGAARLLLDTAEGENRNLTTDEQTSYDRAMEDYDQCLARISRHQQMDQRERESVEPAAEPLPRSQPGVVEDRSSREAEVRARWGGSWDELAPGERDRIVMRATPEYASAFDAYLRRGAGGLNAEEHRALAAGSSSSGGYLTVPEQFVSELLSAVDNAVYVRQLATVIRVPNAQSLGVPTLETDIADCTWTSEILTGSEDSSMAFGKRALHPHPLAKRIKVSNKLVRVAVMSVDQLVRDRLAYKHAIAQESAFLTGSGSNQPLGLFTASSQGISTSRDVSTGNTSTAIGSDGLIEAKFALKAQYQGSPSTRWLFHRDAVKNIRKLKLGTGEYIWQSGLARGVPDTILDVPYIMSEYVPNTFTSALYVGLIGDMRFYWIADALDMSIQVVDQLYAETNQVGYFGRLECDGMPVLEEAFARVKLG